MNPLLAGVALAVVAGAVVAVSARLPRVVVLALAIVMVATPALAEPSPTPLALAARILGALLAAYLLWIAVRDRPADGLVTTTVGSSRLGWPTNAMLAAAAAVVGFAADGLGVPALGPTMASVAGFAIAAVAIIPVLTARDVLRMGVALIVLLHGGILVRVALDGTPGELEQLLITALVVVLGGTVAALARSARLDGAGGYAFSAEGRGRVRRAPDAHRVDAA